MDAQLDTTFAFRGTTVSKAKSSLSFVTMHNEEEISSMKSDISSLERKDVADKEETPTLQSQQNSQDAIPLLEKRIAELEAAATKAANEHAEELEAAFNHIATLEAETSDGYTGLTSLRNSNNSLKLDEVSKSIQTPGRHKSFRVDFKETN